MLATVGFTDDRPAGRLGISVSGRLVASACAHFGVTVDELRSQRRHGPISRARWAIAHVLIDRVGWSYPRAARLLDKDHSSLIYGVREAEKLLREDESFYNLYEAIRNDAGIP